MPNVSFRAPTDYEAELADIERRRAYAKALQDQGMQQMGTETAGGWAIPRSPMEYAGRAAQQMAGAYGQKKATDEQKALAARIRKEGQADVTGFMAALQGTPAGVGQPDPQEMQQAADQGTPEPQPFQTAAVPGDRQKALAIALQSQNPMVQGAGGSILSQMLKGPEKVDLGGSIGFMQNGQIVATIPKSASPDTTIKEGGLDRRFGGVSGNTAATLAAGAPNKPFNPDGTPNTAYQRYELGKAAAGANRVTVDNRAEGAYAQKVAGGAADRDEGQVKSAQAAVENLQKLDSVINHLKTSSAITGLGTDVLKNVERARVLFTQSKAAGKRVSDTELLDTMLGSDVFPMIASLGIGARGMDTPAEREFLRNVMTGTTALNKDTLIKMTEVRRDIAKRAIDRYNKRVEGGELDQYFRFSGMPKQKIEMPGAPAPGAPAGAAPSSNVRTVDW